MWYKRCVSVSALDDMISQISRELGSSEPLSSWDVLGGHSSIQAKLNRLKDELGAEVTGAATHYGQLEAMREEIEAQLRRTQEAFGYSSYASESISAATALQPYHLEGVFGGTAASVINAAYGLPLSGIAEQSTAALASGAASSSGISSAIVELETSRLTRLEQAAAAGVITPLQADIFSSDSASAALGVLPDFADASALSTRVGIAALDSAHFPYLDKFQESVRDYAAQEAERLKRLTEAFTPASVSTLGDIRPSDRYFAEAKRLSKRHGAHFTMQQALALESIARTAERILAARNHRLIKKNIAFVAYGASFGSKILLFYVWLLLCLWNLLDRGLFDTPQVQKVHQSIKHLLPPPDPPLDRHPKVKPNAPNITA